MKINLLIGGRSIYFLKEVVQGLKKNPALDIRTEYWSDEYKGNIELLQWADVIIAEWCLNNAVWYSTHKLPHQKLIVRLHRFELETPFPKLVKLENVNHFICVGPHILNKVKESINLPDNKSVLLLNYVDFNKFSLSKESNSQFNIGMIGFYRKIKRLDRTVHILERLKKYDERYKLFLKGKMPEEYEWVKNSKSEMSYFKEIFRTIKQSKIKDSIIFDGSGNDVHLWLKKIGFILSTSDVESFHRAPAEGMTSGSIPMITGWEGADLIYPKEYVKQSVDEIVEAIIKLNQNTDLYQQKQLEVMEYSKTHFNFETIYKKWENLIFS